MNNLFKQQDKRVCRTLCFCLSLVFCIQYLCNERAKAMYYHALGMPVIFQIFFQDHHFLGQGRIIAWEKNPNILVYKREISNDLKKNEWMNHFVSPVSSGQTFQLLLVFYYSKVIKFYIPDLNFVGQRVHIFLTCLDFLVKQLLLFIHTYQQGKRVPPGGNAGQLLIL